jgi:hypothetical protein
MARLTPRDEGRVRRAVAGSGDRAQRKLEAIAKERAKAIHLDDTEPLAPKDGVPQYRWPLHARHGTHPGTDTRPPLENHVTVARAREVAGLSLNEYDRRALAAHPHPTTYERAMAKAAADYRTELDAHGNPHTHDVLQ